MAQEMSGRLANRSLQARSSTEDQEGQTVSKMGSTQAIGGKPEKTVK